MTFYGIDFFLFLPLAVAIHWLLPRRRVVQNGYLLLVSYLFFLSWSPKLLPLLLLSTAVDYYAAILIERYRSADASGVRRARWVLAASLVWNLGCLVVFKYLGFLTRSVNSVLESVGAHANVPLLKLALPIGVSFWTIQKIAYVLDVYDGRLPASRSKLDFATFVAFFPKMMAGPIVRGSQLLPQLASERSFGTKLLTGGVGVYFLGFVLKAYVGDYLAGHLVDDVFARSNDYSIGAHWFALFAYAVQVFGDFAGYSLMAIGAGRLVGIELPENFNYPFLSKSLSEFWRRWHITLNTFLFDYLYTPAVTGTGWLRERFDVAFVLVFVLSGLWHGPSWTFIVWGLAHGLGLVVWRRWDEFYRGLCKKDRSYVALRKRPVYAASAWGLTQLFFALTLCPFRATSLGQAGQFFKGLFVPGNGLNLNSVSGAATKLNLIVIAVFIVGYNLFATTRFQSWRERFFSLPAPVRGFVYGLTIVYLMLFVPIANGAFIYANF